MEFEKIYNKGQAQLFKNQYLEYLTKTHPLVIWGMYLPVLILLTLLFSPGFTILPACNVFLLFLAGHVFLEFY